MFSVYHLVWLAICLFLIVWGILWLKKNRPGLKKFLSFACVVGVCSELIKTFSVLKLVPSADGTMMYPYIELEHLPFHLCSIQILFIFYCRFAKDSKAKDILLAFMYPSCMLGALAALMMPSIFPDSILPSQAFTHPLGYQYFLFHVMLILLGSYIVISGEVPISGKNFCYSFGIVALLAFVSLYVNSMFSTPNYVNGKLVSVEYVANFFFTYKTPIGIPLTQIWHWYLYIGILFAVVVLLLGLAYLPFALKAQKGENLSKK